MRSVGPMFRYLIVTSILQAMVLFPLFRWVAKYLFAMRGLVSLNNANASRFLLSTPEALFILLVLTMVPLMILLKVGGFVRLSVIAIGSDTKPSYLTVIGSILRSLSKIAGPGLVSLLSSALVVLSLTDSALNPSFFTKFRTPNFIIVAIFANPLYAVAYWCLVVLMYAAALMIVFVFHLMLLGDLKTLVAIRVSIRLMKPNMPRFAAFMFLAILLFAIFTAPIIGAVAGPHFPSMMAVPEGATALATFVGFVFVILLILVVGLMASLVVPLELHLLASRYYASLRKLPDPDPLRLLVDVVPTMPSKKRPSLLDCTLGYRVALSFLVAASVIDIAGLFTITADELTAALDIAVVGHCGGPEDTVVESSMEAVEQLITAGVGYVGMDIQRARDGQYVVFHDKNFSRLTHEHRAVHKMTLAEIWELGLGEKSNGRFSNARVPTLEELLERTRGRIGIFPELKGRSVDQQMVDDAVAAVRRHDVLDRVVVISLKYESIIGIKGRHPEVTSGFIYFLSLGDIAHLVDDYLILEEDAATSDTITQIHEVGRCAAVWIVNTEEPMQKFANWSADAVITDRARQWQAAAAERRRATPLDALMSEFIEQEAPAPQCRRMPRHWGAFRGRMTSSAFEHLSPVFLQRAAWGTAQSLRVWQAATLELYATTQPCDFLRVITPGTGKTTFALRAAHQLLHTRIAKRVVVVTPTEHLKTQWADVAARVGICLDPGTGGVRRGRSRQFDGSVVTRAGVSLCAYAYETLCNQVSTLVIFGETHHAGDTKSWGGGVLQGFSGATHRLALTGTPFRSDDSPIPFVTYEESESGVRISRADYTYGYREALADYVVRPVILMNYGGQMRWRMRSGEVLGAEPGTMFTKDLTAHAWRTALLPTGEWIPAVLRAADQRLTRVRRIVPDAGGLVIATNQAAVCAYARILTGITGKHPTVILFDDARVGGRTEEFAASRDRWMVAVRMVSEGVDVLRLAVGVYATSTSTPLFFVQAAGRFARSRRRGRVATMFPSTVPILLAHAATLEKQRDHVLGCPRFGETDIWAETEAPIDAANREEAASDDFLDELEALELQAIFSRVLFDSQTFRIHAEPTSQDELDYLGLLSLLEPDQVSTLLAERQRRQFRRHERRDPKSQLEVPLHWALVSQCKELNSLVAQLVRLEQRPHSHVHADLCRECGGSPLAQATTEQAAERIARARAWLRY